MWLQGVQKHLVEYQGYENPILFGFDVNGHGFDLSLMSVIRLLEHDCMK